MDLERERGITIKAQAVRVFYESQADGQTYQLHLIDTPGHVDFTYEVSRSLAGVRGGRCSWSTPPRALRRRRSRNTYLAVDSGLELIPCLNKVDLPGAEPERVAEEVADLLGEPGRHGEADQCEDRRRHYRRSRRADRASPASGRGPRQAAPGRSSSTPSSISTGA